MLRLLTFLILLASPWVVSSEAPLFGEAFECDQTLDGLKCTSGEHSWTMTIKGTGGDPVYRSIETIAPVEIKSLEEELTEMGYDVRVTEMAAQMWQVSFEKFDETEGRGLFKVPWEQRISGEAIYAGVPMAVHFSLQRVDVQAEEKPPWFGDWKEVGLSGTRDLESHIQTSYSKVQVPGAYPPK